MDFKIIQSSNIGYHGVFAFYDVLDQQELENLTNTILKITEKDVMQGTTNVKATMSHWHDLLKEKDFLPLAKKISYLLNIIIKLRTTAINQGRNIIIKEAWGMRHLGKQHTVPHDHGFEGSFSGAFCCKTPKDTPVLFQALDFLDILPMADNMLILFPSTLQHCVPASNSEEERISCAFNMDVKGMN